VRIPSACCGTAGLKTTWGRVPLEGVWPLAPSFDTVGPMARDVAGLVLGMELLEPGFAVGDAPDVRVGRLRVAAHPSIDAAIDRALAVSEWTISPLELPSWGDVTAAGGILLVAEAWESDHELVERNPDKIGTDVVRRLQLGARLHPRQLASLRGVQRGWEAEVDRIFSALDVVVTPTLTIFPPPLDGGDDLLMARCTVPVNLAGLPALALPVPSSEGLPASIQLIGPRHSEELLLAAGLRLEAAVASL
jgi:amidase